jgi:hypothetical protein
MTRPEPHPPAAVVPDPAATMPAVADEGTGASRRTFFAGAGVAAVGSAAVVALASAGPAAAATVTTAGSSSSDLSSAGPAHGAAVVAYVRNATTGEIRLMSGEREVVVHDRALARTLTRLSAQEG